MTDRGPLRALAGVPGLRGALVRAALAALGQTVGVVLLAAGLAEAVARAAGLADGSSSGPLLLAAVGVGVLLCRCCRLRSAIARASSRSA